MVEFPRRDVVPMSIKLLLLENVSFQIGLDVVGIADELVKDVVLTGNTAVELVITRADDAVPDDNVVLALEVSLEVADED